jgi:hypothetical protein
MMRLIGLVLGLLLLFGCASKGYWMVTDPFTKNVYYTQSVDSLASGAVKFTDGQTGKAITLQNSEVKKMTEEEFKAAMGSLEKK